MNITRCTECNHADLEHDEQPVPRSARCSFGWCKCSQLRGQVRSTGLPDTITPIPDRWATR